MKTKRFTKSNVLVLAISSLLLFIALNASFVAFAYFSSEYYSQSRSRMDVRMIFGMLDPSLNPTGPWGSETNPYLIAENQHLINLQILQNRSDRSIVNDTSVFQVSTTFGKPVYIGSQNTLAPLEMSSIGTEEYPFTSIIRGVRTETTGDFAQLPGGKVSDTSVLGNIKVVAGSSQIDVGLFGNVGPTTAPLDGNPVGELSTLLLYNVQIDTTAVGLYQGGHSYFVSGGTYETNHIGILAGHAQYTSINNISVYYSGPSSTQQQKDIQAFKISAGTTAKYTTASGIIGHYKNIIINESTSLPVSSTGFPDQLGGNETGLGLGVVNSQDIWSFMESETFNGTPASQEEYDIQQTFGTELYGASNTAEKYFNIGVFTFSHSKQGRSKDKLSKLWKTTEPNSNQWTTSTSSNYTTTDQNQGPAKKYTITRVTSSHVTSSSSTAGTNTRHTVTAFPATDYRFMIVVPAPNNTYYALMRYGSTAVAQKIDLANFVVTDEQLNYYTMDILTSRSSSTLYPPYESGWSYRYHTKGNLIFSKGSYATTQYAAYGDEITINSVITEAPRPLRIYYDATAAPTASFMATSSASYPEAVRIIPNVSGNLWGTSTTPKLTYDTFKFQRMYSASASFAWYLQYTDTQGFTATGTSGAAGTNFQIYAVRVTNSPTPGESPVVVNNNKRINTATGTTKTYDFRYDTLFYTGDYDSADPTEKYTYDIRTIESLNWYKNDGEVLTEANHVLKMADPTSYYFVNNRYFGVTENIVSPIDKDARIRVPEGSVGFTVNGTDSDTYSKIFVIVATDPKQFVDQEITISRFGANNNQNGDRSEISRFVLPPPPGLTDAYTQPIYVTENGSEFTAYQNLNTLLVAYEFSVSSRYTITYFLEASRGSGNFVYLSAERIASTDNNPTHENDISFPHLNDIDFVDTFITNTNRIATVGSGGYVSTLTSLYFGLKANPLNPEGENPNLDAVIIPITSGFNFTYSIGRMYNSNDEKYYLYITIIVNGFPTSISKAQLIQIMNNMNFNYSETTVINSTTFEYSFSDVMMMTINGYTITDWTNDLI